jgi:hypothetical protein
MENVKIDCYYTKEGTKVFIDNVEVNYETILLIEVVDNNVQMFLTNLRRQNFWILKLLRENKSLSGKLMLMNFETKEIREVGIDILSVNEESNELMKVFAVINESKESVSK